MGEVQFIPIREISNPKALNFSKSAARPIALCNPDEHRAYSAQPTSIGQKQNPSRLRKD